MSPHCCVEWSDVVNTDVGEKPQQEVTREYIHCRKRGGALMSHCVNHEYYTMGGMRKPEHQHNANSNITDPGKDSSMGTKPLSERLSENRIFTLFQSISPQIT